MREITKEAVVDWLPVRGSDTYKGKMGRILCVGGNRQTGGAIIMSALAALYSGAGLVTVASAPENVSAVHSHAPEIMFLDMYDTDQLEEMVKTMDVIVVGPGLGTDRKALEIVKVVMGAASDQAKVIVDADAITLVSRDKQLAETAGHLVYTPHIGEWERLTGLDQQASVALNLEQQARLGATVVLKGAPTVVYFDHEVWKNTTGNPAQATGGMGDTLAGMLAGFIGQYDSCQEAVLSATFIHSYIADQLAETHYVTLPTQIIQEIPTTMKTFVKQKGDQGDA